MELLSSLAFGMVENGLWEAKRVGIDTRIIQCHYRELHR